MKKLTAMVLAMMMTLSLAACKSSSEPAEETPAAPDSSAETPAEAPAESADYTLVTDGVLTIATNAEFPPYEFREGDQFVGIEMEMAQNIADSLGLELHVEDMAFDSVILAVTSGKADLGVSGFTVTEDRKQTVDFTDSYVKASQLIIVHKDNTEIKTADDLTGKVIGVQLGTTGDIYAGDIEGATVERYNKGVDAVQALAQKKIDAVMIDDQVAKALAAQTDQVVVIEEPFTVEDYAIVVSKENPALTAKVNEVIKEMQESGELQAIVDKYISAE